MRGWDISEAVFSQDMWALYCNILRADCTLFDSYDYSTSHAFSSAAHGAGEHWRLHPGTLVGLLLYAPCTIGCSFILGFWDACMHMLR